VSPFFLDFFQRPVAESLALVSPVAMIKKDVCSYFAQNPNRTKIALKKINDALQANNETTNMFPLTTAYINANANRDKLIGGTEQCSAFFDDIKDKLMADCKNKEANNANAQQKAINMLKNFHSILKSVMQ
jgi:hypothetical protein